jgi:phosphoglycerol transferase
VTDAVGAGAIGRVLGRRGGQAAALVIGALLCLVLTGWAALDFREPISFHGDHLLTLGNARSYVDGNGFRSNDHLGFPGRRDYLFHAGFYFSQKSIMWLAARFTGNPATVVHAFYGLGIVLVFLACYWSLRHLSIGRGLAWFGSLVFVVTPYFAVRSGMHDMLSVYYSVPLGAVLAIRLGMTHAAGPLSALRQRRLADPLSWALVLAVGTSGLYYAFFTTMFVAFVGLVMCWPARSAVPALRAALLCAGVVGVLLVTGPGAGLLEILSGDVPLTRRFAMEQELYGLVPLDAVNVLPHVPPAPAGWPIGVDAASSEGTWGEWPGLVLTLTIFLSPFIALWAFRTRWTTATASRRPLLILCAACLALGVLFATRGGLGLLFNEFVTPAIRAQNRITPFLTFFALVIVLVCMERAMASVRQWAGLAVAALIAAGLVVSAWPSVGFLHAKQRAFLGDSREQADRASLRAMLDRVRALDLRTVLQLPVAPWPEVPPIGEFVPYRFELAHILDDRRSPVRWSYGMSPRQPEFQRLVSVVDAHREGGLADAAIALGFDAAVIEKAALSPAELASWMAALGGDPSLACPVFDDDRRVLYRLGRAGAVGACAPIARPRPASRPDVRPGGRAR